MQTTTFTYNDAEITIRERIGADRFRAQWAIAKLTLDTDDDMGLVIGHIFSQKLSVIQSVDGDPGFPLPALANGSKDVTEEDVVAAFEAIMFDPAHADFMDVINAASEKLRPAPPENADPKVASKSGKPSTKA